MELNQSIPNLAQSRFYQPKADLLSGLLSIYNWFSKTEYSHSPLPPVLCYSEFSPSQIKSCWSSPYKSLYWFLPLKSIVLLDFSSSLTFEFLVTYNCLHLPLIPSNSVSSQNKDMRIKVTPRFLETSLTAYQTTKASPGSVCHPGHSLALTSPSQSSFAGQNLPAAITIQEEGTSSLLDLPVEILLPLLPPSHLCVHWLLESVPSSSHLS